MNHLLSLILSLFLRSTTPAHAAPAGPGCPEFWSQVGRASQANVAISTDELVSPGYPQAVLDLLRGLHIREAMLTEKLAQLSRKTNPTEIEQLRLLKKLQQSFENEIQPLVRSFESNKKLREVEASDEMRNLIDEDQASLKLQIAAKLQGQRTTLLNLLRPTQNVAHVEIGKSSGTFSEVDLQRLLKMYTRYAESKKWDVVVLNESVVDGEVRQVTLQITGPRAYNLMSLDRGDHRIIEAGTSSASRYTRYARVNVYRPPEPREFSVRDEDFRFTATRSSGAGGQHVNTTDSAVQLTHIPTGETVKVSNERSQHKNLATAKTLLTARLYADHLAEIAKAARTARAEGRVNSRVVESAARWTRTYDFSADRPATERLLQGAIGAQLVLAQEQTLEQQIIQFRQELENGNLRFQQ